MKILHIIARFNVGGTAAWIATLSAELEKKGHLCEIITGNVAYPEVESELIKGLKNYRVSELGKALRLLNEIKAFLQIRKLINLIQPDLVNTHTAKAGVLGRLAVLSLGANRPTLVHTMHGHLLRGYFGYIKLIPIIWIEKFLSNFTDVMLFAGKRVRKDCLDVGIGTPDRSYVVCPGVSINVNVDSTQSVEKVDCHPSRLRIGWLARVTVIKRPDRVLAIARKLPEIDFFIGGDGELLPELQKIAPTNCHFLGLVNPNEFWPMMDLALLTSDNEALPISLIEAQLFGLPTVATDAGSTAEVVLDGVNGFITSFSVDELVEAILRLSSDTKLRETFGEQAKKRAQSEFSPQKQCDDHLNAYNVAINIHKSQGNRP